MNDVIALLCICVFVFFCIKFGILTASQFFSIAVNRAHLHIFCILYLYLCICVFLYLFIKLGILTASTSFQFLSTGRTSKYFEFVFLFCICIFFCICILYLCIKFGILTVSHFFSIPVNRAHLQIF